MIYYSKNAEEAPVSGKILQNYVSEIDQLLIKFDKEHPLLSKSQLKEVKKYELIYFLRDIGTRLMQPKKLWEGF